MRSSETSNRTPGFGPVHTGFEVPVQYHLSPTFMIQWSRIEIAVSLVMGFVYLNSRVLTSTVLSSPGCRAKPVINIPKRAINNSIIPFFISNIFKQFVTFYYKDSPASLKTYQSTFLFYLEFETNIDVVDKLIMALINHIAG